MTASIPLFIPDHLKQYLRANGFGDDDIAEMKPEAAWQHPPPLLAAAWRYAARGWHVLPLHWTGPTGHCSCGVLSCASPGKHPRTEHGLSDATTDPDQIRTWWTRWPQANIGIHCGLSGLVVMDLDVKNGKQGPDTWRDLCQDEGIDDSPALEQETSSGGVHLVFGSNGHAIGPSTNTPAADIDVRAGNSYILVEPSVIAGKPYTWDAMSSPLDGREPGPVPDALLKLLAKPDPVATPPADIPLATTPMDTAANPQRNYSFTEDMLSAIENLGKLAPERASDYSQWVEVGQALHAGLGDAGLQLWDDWSKGDPSKYRPGECARRWQGFTAGKGLTLASLAHWAKEDETAKQQMSQQSASPAYHLTDLGNAERFVARFGNDVRYCERLGGWHVWDGCRWILDEIGKTERAAQIVARALYTEAANEDDANRRAALAKWALSSESASRQRGILDLAWSQSGIAVMADVFDTHPWMLNVQNGTVDLRTGMLREHRREDMLTKLAPVDYDPDAADLVWDRCLQHVGEGDPDFADYLQRAVGYTLTGLVQEKAMFLLLGNKDTGKTTFTEALAAMLGDYAVVISLESLVTRGKDAERDTVRLRGSRFAYAEESDKGMQLKNGFVKMLTGGGSIPTRYLYKEKFELDPTHKLWLACNTGYEPQIDDLDAAMWARLKRLPFTRPIKLIDKTVMPHLKESPQARSAVLAWAIEGCLLWQKHGLGTCKSVTDGTEELRKQMDPLAAFLEEKCVLGDKYKTAATALRAAYTDWAKLAKCRAISNREWGERLRAEGCESKRDSVGAGQATFWHGIALQALTALA